MPALHHMHTRSDALKVPHMPCAPAASRWCWTWGCLGRPQAQRRCWSRREGSQGRMQEAQVKVQVLQVQQPRLQAAAAQGDRPGAETEAASARRGGRVMRDEGTCVVAGGLPALCRMSFRLIEAAANTSTTRAARAMASDPGGALLHARPKAPYDICPPSPGTPRAPPTSKLLPLGLEKSR